MVYPIPLSLTTRIGASSLLQGLTALSCVTEAYNQCQERRHDSRSHRGRRYRSTFSPADQSEGAKFIGTTSTEEKKKIVLENGADEVILYESEDTVQRVMDITKGMGVDGIFDGVGKDTIDDDFQMIKRKGTIVSVGNTSGVIPPFPVLRLVEKNVTFLRPTWVYIMHPFPSGLYYFLRYNNYCFTAAECHHYGTQLWRLIENGSLEIHVHDEYPFTRDEIIQAQKDLVGEKTVGKLVVSV